MNNTWIRENLKAGNFKIFDATLVENQEGIAVMVDDLIRVLKMASSDLRRTTPAGMSSAVAIVAGLQKMTVMLACIPSNQASIEADPNETIEQSARKETEIKVRMFAEVAQQAIDIGNDAAKRLASEYFTSEGVADLMRKSRDEKISRRVAARSRGDVRQIEFEQGTRTLGGRLDTPSEFLAATETRLSGYCVAADRGNGELVLLHGLTKEISAPEIVTANGKVSLHVDPQTTDGKLMEFAKPARAKVEISVAVKERLSNRKQSIVLTEIYNRSAIHASAQARLDELSNDLSTLNTP